MSWNYKNRFVFHLTNYLLILQFLLIWTSKSILNITFNLIVSTLVLVEIVRKYLLKIISRHKFLSHLELKGMKMLLMNKKITIKFSLYNILFHKLIFQIFILPYFFNDLEFEIQSEINYEIFDSSIIFYYLYNNISLIKIF